jgi:hypothetical protein
MLGGVLAALAVAQLARREHSLQELLGVLLDHLPNAHAFDNVSADANDFHVWGSVQPRMARITRIEQGQADFIRVIRAIRGSILHSTARTHDSKTFLIL